MARRLPSVKVTRHHHHVRSRDVLNSKWVKRFHENKKEWDAEREKQRIAERTELSGSPSTQMIYGASMLGGFVRSSNITMSTTVSLPSGLTDEFTKFTLPPINVRQALPCQSWQLTGDLGAGLRAGRMSSGTWNW